MKDSMLEEIVTLDLLNLALYKPCHFHSMFFFFTDRTSIHKKQRATLCLEEFVPKECVPERIWKFLKNLFQKNVFRKNLNVKIFS